MALDLSNAIFMSVFTIIFFPFNAFSYGNWLISKEKSAFLYLKNTYRLSRFGFA